MKKGILIVDDEQSLLTSMQRDLRELESEFDIYTATNGNEASNIMEKSEIDLLITDIFMPEKEGIELIREIKTSYPITKIITMSGGGIRGGIDYLEVAKQLGSSCILKKPFTRDELIATIRYTLSMS